MSQTAEQLTSYLRRRLAAAEAEAEKLRRANARLTKERNALRQERNALRTRLAEVGSAHTRAHQRINALNDELTMVRDGWAEEKP